MSREIRRGLAGVADAGEGVDGLTTYLRGGRSVEPSRRRGADAFAARIASLSAKDLPVPCVFHCLFGPRTPFWRS